MITDLLEIELNDTKEIIKFIDYKRQVYRFTC